MRKFTIYDLRFTILGLWTLAIGLWTLPVRALTPFYLQGFNSDGTVQTNKVYVSQYPATSSPFSVYGTNIIFGGNVMTLLPSATGYASNAIYPGRYRFYITNLNSSFTATILDTTNFGSLALYIDNPATVSSGTPLSSSQLITNLLGFIPANAATTNDFARAANTNDFARATPAGITNALAFIPANAANTNDYARLANIGTIASRASNDFALATSVGPIAIRSTNDFALATAVGPMAIRSTNDFALVTAMGLSQSISNLTNVKVITNGAVCLLAYQTNGAPGSAFTNYPTGSILQNTNGAIYFLTNIVWTPL